MLQRLAILALAMCSAGLHQESIVMEGRVVSSDGGPVESAIVLFVAENGAGRWLFLGATRTGAEGRFRLEPREAPAGMDAELHVLRPGVGQQVIPFPEGTDPRGKVEIALDPPARLEVVLLLARTSDLVARDLYVQAQVDRNGPYAWTDHWIDLPKVGLELTQAGGHIRRAQIELISGGAGFELTDRQGRAFYGGWEVMAPGQEERRVVDLSGGIRFRVVDIETGEPVAGARVLGRPINDDPRDRFRILQRFRSTDEEGRVEVLDQTHDQSWQFQFSKTGYSEHRVTVAMSSTDEDPVVVALPCSTVLRGHVRVTEEWKLGDLEVVAAVSNGSEADQDRRARVDPEGEFRLIGLPRDIPIQVHVEINGLPVGEPQEIILKAGEDRHIEFVF